jgi:hypothetical protein
MLHGLTILENAAKTLVPWSVNLALQTYRRLTTISAEPGRQRQLPAPFAFCEWPVAGKRNGKLGGRCGSRPGTRTHGDPFSRLCPGAQVRVTFWNCARNRVTDQASLCRATRSLFVSASVWKHGDPLSALRVTQVLPT